MELLKIDWQKIDLGSTLDIGIKVFGFLTAITTFFILNWKWWLKKEWNKWYVHYKNNRNQRWSGLMDVQKEQIANQNEMRTGINKITMQLYPNGGSSLFDKVEKILDNQSVLKEQSEAVLYLDSTPVIKTNMQGECTFANIAYLRTFGFSSFEEAKGTGVYRSVHPDDRERIKKDFLETLRTGNMFVSSYKKINIITGKEINVNTMTRIIRNAKNEPVEAIGVLQLN